MTLVGVELETFISEPDAVFYLFILEVYASQMMALAGVELETILSEPDALTTRCLADKLCFSYVRELRAIVEFQYIYHCQNFTFVVRNFYHH